MGGLAAVGADMITYHFMLIVLPPSPAKAVSFLAGTGVAYLMQKYWTFRVKDTCVKEMSKFGLLYATSLVFNVTVNKLMILLFPMMMLPFLADHKIGLAWFTATGFSTVYNYLGQKFWVFKPKPKADLREAIEEAT